MFGAISAGVFFGVGTVLNTHGAFNPKDLFTSKHLMKAIAHGVAGGINAEIYGGSFLQGFGAGFMAGALSPAADAVEIRTGSEFAGYATAAVSGGLGAELTGGDFEYGAITGFFSRAFNDKGEEIGKRRSNRIAAQERNAKLRELGLNPYLTPGEIAEAMWDGAKGAGEFWERAIVDRNAPGGSIIHHIELTGMGFSAFVDGAIDIIPMVDFKPLESYGFYDSSQYNLDISQAIGGVTRDTALFFGGAAAWRAAPILGGGSISTSSSLGLSGMGFTPLNLAIGGNSSLSLLSTSITVNAGRVSSIQNVYGAATDSN